MKKPAGKKVAVSVKRVQAPRTKRSVKRAGAPDEMRDHYDFDYSRSRPNRFASGASDGAIVVVLDPDVATVFQSAEAVNAFLRSAITAMPQPEASKKRRVS